MLSKNETKNKENNEKEPLGKNSNIATIYFNNLYHRMNEGSIHYVYKTVLDILFKNILSNFLTLMF